MLKSLFFAGSTNWRSRSVLLIRERSIVAVNSKPLALETHLHRNVSSKAAERNIVVEDSFVKKFFKTVGWVDHARTRLKLSGYFLYESITGNILYTEWFEVCEIPDSFTSWFAVTELHVWMMLVRAMAEDVNVAGKKEKYLKEGDGKFVRNCILEALWADVANRVKSLEDVNQTLARKQVMELSEQFQAVLVSYDEGMHDDRILAAAIWRRIFNMELVDAEHVERVVKLVRKQMMELDKIPWKTLIKQPEMDWIGIKEF